MSLPNCEKDYNESNKNMQVTYYPGTSTSYQFKIFNCKIGG